MENICKEMLALDASKATQSDDRPTKIIQNNFDIFLIFFKRTLIALLKQVLFPEKLRYADVKPVFKKDS